jgi:hypothetical protein
VAFCERFVISGTPYVISNRLPSVLARAETLSIEEFARLADKLFEFTGQM